MPGNVVIIGQNGPLNCAWVLAFWAALNSWKRIIGPPPGPKPPPPPP